MFCRRLIKCNDSAEFYLFLFLPNQSTVTEQELVISCQASTGNNPARFFFQATLKPYSWKCEIRLSVATSKSFELQPKAGVPVPLAHLPECPAHPLFPDSRSNSNRWSLDRKKAKHKSHTDNDLSKTLVRER